MTNLFDVILFGLAGWRIASLLVYEDGPYHVFTKLRDRVIGEGEVEGFLPSLFTCIYCMTGWTSLAAFLIFQISPEVVMLFAAMTVALLADHFKPD